MDTRNRIGHAAAVEVARGRTAIALDGRTVSSAAYCDYILRDGWEERIRQFAESGVSVYHLQVSHGAHGPGHDFFDSAFWVDDGVYPEDDFPYPLSLDRQAETILTCNGWMFDQSTTARDGSRQWLDRNYADDRALQEAWGKPDVTRATATVPLDSDWQRKRRETAPTLNGKPVAEVEAGLRRNAALPLSRGWQGYWCNVGSAYFDDPEIQRTVAGLVPATGRLEEAPHRETRDGNVAIFGPATGITDGRVLTADPAAALFGMPMELLPRTTVRHVLAQHAGHAISRELPAGFVYGDSLPYGPTLVPGEWAVERNGGVPLGHANLCFFIHRTGLFVKDFGLGAAGNGRAGIRGDGDCTAVWSVAMPLPPEVLRACARYAGCHVWCEEGHQVYASDSMVSVHSVTAGPVEIRLPRPCRVRDAISGEMLGSAPVETIAFDCMPPETRVYLLEE